MSLKKTDRNILIVDDKFDIRESLKAIFTPLYRVLSAENAAMAMDLLDQYHVDLILLDIVMPDKDGMELFQEIRTANPDIPVIMVSALSATRRVVDAMRMGAYDYITKPFDVDDIRRVVRRALDNTVLQRKIEILETEVSQEFPVHGVIGESAPIRRVLEITQKTAKSDSTVLISGESGTGKELFARLIHDQSDRCSHPFVAVHCAALSESLMESELFGYEKGAFTHAEKRKLGRFDLAGSGTLFFDEVSEMSLSTQVKLLRVLQEREFMRLGGTQVINTSARIIAASARDLKDEVKAGRIRDDLYYRLSVVPIALPPLRERCQDIPLLANYFLDYFRRKMNISVRYLESETMDFLCAYTWPGNIRELRNLIERILVLHGQSVSLSPECLPPELIDGNGTYKNTDVPPITLSEAVNNFEREIIEKALKETGGNQSRAAERIGTTRRILKYRMEKLEIGEQPSGIISGKTPTLSP